mmetsp:Transcript_49/g.102  ORF Transcript_49/g.102 Transcript_49/m.102 type:complete len:233 (-) Transcript_49:2-700(-)
MYPYMHFLVFIIANMLFVRTAAFTSHACRRAFPSLVNQPHPITVTARCLRPSTHQIFSHASEKDSSNDADESIHRKYYSITGTGQRSTVKMETNTGHNLQTDVPRKIGGGDSAPQPVEHLLAALVGCTQATAVYVGRMMKPRLIIDRIEFDIHAHRDERGALELPIDECPKIPARLQRVSGKVMVYFKKGVQVSEEQLKILGEQTEARCPVANMMHASNCVMDIQWVNGDIS